MHSLSWGLWEPLDVGSGEKPTDTCNVREVAVVDTWNNRNVDEEDNGDVQDNVAEDNIERRPERQHGQQQETSRELLTMASERTFFEAWPWVCFD